MLELLLVMASITIIASLSLPIYSALQPRNDLNVATNVTAQSLRRAQLLSQSGSGNTTWGVKVQPGSIVVFKGANYTSRDAAYDEIFPIAGNISVSGISEVVFDKTIGNAQTTGNLTLISPLNGENLTVNINAKGTVTY